MIEHRRDLTDDERAVIERLLSVDFPEVGHFRAQVAHAVVRAACGCGCGTIELEVDAAKAPRAPSHVWDDEPGPIVEGDEQSWLMLFQSGGMLSELEHVAGHGPGPRDLDAARIVPDVQVDADRFDGGR